MHVALQSKEKQPKARALIRITGRLSRNGLLACLLLSTFACVATPRLPRRSPGIVVPYDLEVTRVAAAVALGSLGFVIKENSPSYVEGFHTRRYGWWDSEGGETLGVWLEETGERRTRIRVATAKSFVGWGVQKNWDMELYNAIRRALRSEVSKKGGGE